jgi:thioredoxin 1
VIKVNVDKNQAAAMKYGIRGIPTLILFNKRNILWRQSGMMSKTTLQSTVENFLK